VTSRVLLRCVRVASQIASGSWANFNTNCSECRPSKVKSYLSFYDESYCLGKLKQVEMTNDVFLEAVVLQVKLVYLSIFQSFYKVKKVLNNLDTENIVVLLIHF